MKRFDYCRKCVALLQAAVVLAVLALMLVHLRLVIGPAAGDRAVDACNAVVSLMIGLQSVVLWYRWRELRCP